MVPTLGGSHMTVSAEQQEKQEAKEAREAAKARTEAFRMEEKKLNEGRSGKGARVFLGMTRGQNPQKIQYEAFDDSQPDTLPVTPSEFMTVTKTTDEALLARYLWEGFNAVNYSEASDPIKQFLNLAWDDDTQKSFRLAVRNYSNMTGLTIEDAVAIIKPGVDIAFAKRTAVSA